ncbi:MAG: hypothetical protein K2M19_03235 [Muribaculaceae bacterium]|nr:hypothetical protein [Muribaculaceae bacterium]
MKLKFIAPALVMMTAASATYAASPEDLRIYINPGHGSWTANDRPMQMVGKDPYKSEGTDTTSFFESNTDLIKGFGVLEKLIEMGFPFDRTLNQTGKDWEIGAAKDLSQNLVMSRVKNGPYHEQNLTSNQTNNLPEDAYYYNRNLPEICAEVEYNEFDMFISIHSNAASSNSVNYHLFMYRGRNEGKGGPAIPESTDMIRATHTYSFANEHAQWSVSSVYINGDIDFMGGGKGSTGALGYYGYLGVLKHGVPGYLVEGYFHTHTPSAHRAMNWDVDMIEGYQYARGVAEYFELEERDATGEIYGIVRDAHTRFSHSLWTGITGTDDVLMPLNETKVFLHKDGQKVAEYVTDNFYNGAFVFMGLEPGTYQITFENEMYAEEKPVEVVVEAGKTTYPKCYLTHIWYNGRPGEELNYPNPVSKDVVPQLAEAYEAKTHYLDRPVAALNGLTPLRMIWMKGKTYILAKDADNNHKIVVYDDLNGETLAVVDTDGTRGTELNLSDIAVTADGVLLASAKELTQLNEKYIEDGEVKGVLEIYCWENDANGVPTGKPSIFVTSEDPGDWYRSYSGETILYSGTVAEGKLVYSNEYAKGSKGAIRNTFLEIADGKIESTKAVRPDKFYAPELGAGYRFVVSPLDRNQFFALNDGTKYGMLEFNIEHTTGQPALNESPASMGKATLGAGFFKFADHAMMTFAAPAQDNITVSLYDISKGLSEAKAVEIGKVELPGASEKILTTGYPVALTNEAGEVTGGEMIMLAFRDGKISRFTTGVVPAGVNDVAVDSNDATATYFDLNGRAVEASRMLPGVYVRVQGGHASKVIVR